jgi:hypothetical protein
VAGRILGSRGPTKKGKGIQGGGGESREGSLRVHALKAQCLHAWKCHSEISSKDKLHASIIIINKIY